MGHGSFACQRINYALLSNAYTIGKRVRQFGKELCHLSWTLEVVFITIEAHTFGGIQLLARLHTEQYIVRAGIMSVNIVQIVGGYQWYAQVFVHLVE